MRRPVARAGTGPSLAAALMLLAGCGREAPAPPLAAGATAAPTRPADALRLPNAAGSIKFAAIGDAGRGDRFQHEVAAQIEAFRAVFPFAFVVMLGDNIYDGATAEDYRQKFELPYKPLLDAGVQFFAAIGNHDDANQPAYAPFHMGGERYYTFTPPLPAGDRPQTTVRFFMVDTERLDRAQLAWLDRELGKSEDAWKIPIFHRPIYTSGRYERPARTLRRALEPLLVDHRVAVAFSGHEHFYERIKPQQGITYFISGGAGSLRAGDIRPTPLTAAGFDRDYHFMLVEIDGDALFYQAISRTGETVDAGVVRRGDVR